MTTTIQERLDKFHWLLDHAHLDKKEYQSRGVQWCLENELRTEVIRGGFIADEMGLGKTIMMIGTMIAHFQRTLIVLPVVLVEQWCREIYRITGHKAIVYHGTRKTKAKYTLEVLSKAPIVITTYGMIKKNDAESVLHQVRWGRIIFDEAHHLRNRKTSLFAGARMLRARIRWLVSGTPVQNKKQDFFNLCALLRIPASFYAEKDNLAILTRNHILKRTKKQVGIAIPDAVVHKKVVSWATSTERILSEKIHSMLAFSRTQFPQGEKPLHFKNFDIIQLMVRAKQSCIMPSLMKGAFCCANGAEDTETGTSKLDAVVQTILERKENGNGKLVFCHYRAEIDTIAQRLRDGGILQVATIDARNKMKSRAQILTRQNDVLILQIQTGCEGLNLQENYSEIYFVTPHWNPSVEDQAVARCHRIGQQKDVSVFRFEMDGFDEEDVSRSFDNYVNTIQERKRGIVCEIIRQ